MRELHKVNKPLAGAKSRPVSIMLDDGALERTIGQIIRRHLCTTRVLEVDVKRGQDRDGDPVLRITVVFDGEPTARDATRRVGLVRHIRAGLEGENAESFPLLSFVSKREAAKLKLAAA